MKNKLDDFYIWKLYNNGTAKEYYFTKKPTKKVISEAFLENSDYYHDFELYKIKVINNR